MKLETRSSKLEITIPEAKRSGARNLKLFLPVAILLAAAFLRLWQLGDVPPGLTHDEAGHGQDAIAILHGARPIYQTVGYGREPLYDYVTAAVMALLGRSDYLALRLSSAALGLLTVALSYAWVRRAFGGWEALISCAWLAGSFWAVSISRQGLRSSLLPPLLAGAVYAWWRGAFDLDHRRPVTWLYFAASGVLAGAALWTYMAARIAWILFLAMPVFLLLTDRARFKQRWGGMLVALGVMALLAGPMFAWLHQHPEAEQRFAQLGGPLDQLAAGDVRPLVANGLEALGMFSLRADDLWMYNLPARPWLGLVDGALFYLGLGLAAWRWRRPPYALALLWLGLGLLPSLVTGVSASATRAVAILPVLYLFPAIVVSSFRSQLSHLTSHVSRLWPALILLASLSIVFETGRTYHDYFNTWANARDVRVAYHTTLFETARELDRLPVPSGETVVLSSIYPGQYHDPHAFGLLLARRDLALRWMDGRGALLFPSQPSTLVIPALAPLDPALQAAIAPPYVQQISSRRLRSDDLNPGFDVYAWDSPQALEALLGQATPTPFLNGAPLRNSVPAAWSASATFPPDDPQSVYQPLDLPADLGHTIALAGYSMSSQEIAPGSELVLVTYWRILARPAPGLDSVLFTHMLSPGGGPPIVAQQDRLDAPTWDWQGGEVVAQVHRLAISIDTPPGLYPLEVGAYTRRGPSPLDPDPPATRLVLYVDGQAAGDRVLLLPLRVR
ncbi:MAG: glycosyltransferase family 39 protein [Thermoflexales bacterium]|nr:glycosyltransferase family 39 protein [Thermoflexales bacterium]